MSYRALVYRVMIASPSDVPTERQIVRDVVAGWTAVHSADKEAVLLPVSWESHASPEMGARPQEIINRRLLEDCDLLIAVFWTRIGSPSGEAVSGTVEEIQEHIAKGKPAMIYFSEAPVRLDSVDPGQYEEVKKFREVCKASGLYETYESLADFRDKLTRQLAATMIRVCDEGAASAGPITATDFILADQGPRSHSPTLSLSPTAKELLKAMSADDGSVLRMRVMEGTAIQAAGRLLNKQGDARDTARWEAAIHELSGANLIEQTDSKGEVFRLTHDGYGEADKLPGDWARP